MKKQNFIEWNNNILLSSLKKISLNIILIIILDASFYLLSGYLFIFWLQRVQSRMAAFNLPSDITSLGYVRAQLLVSEVKSFYYLIIFSFILLVLAVIFLATILKGIIWAKTTKTKITLGLISKFFVLNIIWLGFWFLLVILISLFVQPAQALFFMISAIALGLYFTNTVYTLFMRKQSLRTIFESVKLNIAKVHLFLLPYAIIALLLYVLIKIFSLLKFRYSSILLGLVILAYAAIMRHYTSTLVLDVAR